MMDDKEAELLLLKSRISTLESRNKHLERLLSDYAFQLTELKAGFKDVLKAMNETVKGLGGDSKD